MILSTVLSVVMCVVIAMALGTKLAVDEAHGGRNYFLFASIGAAIPTYLVALSVTGLFDYGGVFSDYLLVDLRNVYTLGIVQGFCNASIVYLMLRALGSQRQLIEQCLTLGASPFRMYWTMLCANRKIAAYAAMYCVLESLNDLGSASFLSVETLATTIYRTWSQTYSFYEAALLSIPQVLLGAALIAAKPSEANVGTPQAGQKSSAWYAAPYAFVFLSLLIQHTGVPILWADNFLLLAPAAIAVTLSLFLVPTLSGALYAIPSVLLGIGVYSLFGAGTIPLCFALALKCKIFSDSSVSEYRRNIPREIKDAASQFTPHVFWKLELPMMRRQILGAVCLLLMELYRELPITLVLAPPNFRPIAVQLFERYSDGYYDQAAGIGLVMFAMGIITALAYNWTKRTPH